MPLQTRAYDLAEEVQRLEDRRRELAAEARALAPDDPERQALIEENADIETYLDGLEGVLDPPAAVSIPQFDHVTLAGLTGGEYGRVEDTLVDAALDRGNDSVGNGAQRVHLVAKGTVEAPYVDSDAGYDQRVAATAQLPLGYLKWAESRVDEMTSVGNDERESFESLLAATSTSEPSDAADAS